MSNQNSMQPVIEPVILAKDMPVTLLQPDSIVELCKAGGYEHTSLVIRHESQGVPVAWVKYGVSVTMGEARTQAYIAEVINANPDAKARIAQVSYILLSSTAALATSSWSIFPATSVPRPTPPRWLLSSSISPPSRVLR
jgi:hypothetical protein